MAEAKVVIGAQDRASAVINHVNQRLGILNKQGLAMGVAFAGVSMAIGAVTSALRGMGQYVMEGIQKWRQFEDQMAEINTMLDLTEKEHLPAMRKAIEDLSIKWGKSASDMADAMYQTLSASVDASRAIEFLNVAARTATAGLASVESAVDVLTTILNAYGMTVSDAEHVSDILFKTVKEGKLRFEDLSNALGFIVPIAAQVGVSIEEVTAALATMTKQGINATMAARGLRMSIANIISPSEEAETAATEYGITMDGLHLSVVDLSGFIDELNENLKGNNLALAEIFPNVRTLTAMMALMANEARIFGETFTEVMEKSGGAASQAALEIVQSGGFRGKALEQLGEQLQRGFGDLEPAMSGFDAGVKRSAERISMFIDILRMGGYALRLNADGIKNSLSIYDEHGRKIQIINDAQSGGLKTQQELRDNLREDAMRIRTATSALDLYEIEVIDYIAAKNTMLYADQASDEQLKAAPGILAANEAAWNAVTDEFNSAAQSIARLKAQQALLIVGLKELDYQIPRVTDQIARLEQTAVIGQDMYRASLSLKGLAIEGNYADETFGQLTETFNQAQVELDRMTDAQRHLTMAQRETSLEMLRIQFAASGRRRGMTRGERRAMEQLEREQLANRIAQMEGTIEIEEFRDDHYDIAKEDYDNYILSYQHQIHVLQDARNEEIENLGHSLELMLGTQLQYNSDLAKVHADLELETLNHYKRMIEWRALYETAGVTVPSEITAGIRDIETNIPTAMPPIWWFTMRQAMNLQRGGAVYETGLALLHRGEHVSPAGQQSAGNTIMVTVQPGAVQITGTPGKNITEVELANALRRAMGAGLIGSNGITKAQRR